MTEESSVERLMSVLITKMEGMDSDLALLKAENERLRSLISSPKGLFRKAGFVPVTTPYADDLMPDPLRMDMENNSILKGGPATSIPQSNEEFHNMSWEDIHEMAQQAKGAPE
jgi:hypothetical protein|tara:strand:+ start:10651 stop:10989 length:339 start_codon:yes stop_codon:yes gene_type:complete